MSLLDRTESSEKTLRVVSKLLENAMPEQSGSEQALIEEIEYDLIWRRDGLSIEDRFVASITAACLLRYKNRIRKLTRVALEFGLQPIQLREIFLQSGIYIGFPVFEEALACVSDILPESQFACDEPNTEQSPQDFRKRLHGELNEIGYADPQKKYAAELYKIATDYAYGHIWRRQGLSLRERLICALAGFTAHGAALDSFKKFAITAAENGLSLVEIREVVIQVSPLSGFPKALQALLALEEIAEKLEGNAA